MEPQAPRTRETDARTHDHVRAGVRPVLALMAGAVFLLLWAAPATRAASSGSTVGVTVQSASNIDASGCLTGTANVTDMGSVGVAQSKVTSNDCTITFGSSNDTAMLKLSQVDRFGAGIWRADDGSLDPSFDGNGGSGDGEVPVDLGGATDIFRDVDHLSDGRLVAVGSDGTDMVVALFDRNGVLDTSFDTDGKQTIDFLNVDTAYTVVVQPDDKIVVGGGFNTGGGVTDGFAIARLNVNGTLDTTFDTDGKWSNNFCGGIDLGEYFNGLTIDQNGDIYGVGNDCWNWLTVRFNSDGSLDTGFNGTGSILDNWSGIDIAQDVVVDSSGRPVVIGTGENVVNGASGPDMVAVRYNTDGTRDTGFGGGGTGEYAREWNVDYGTAIKLDETGRILLGGWVVGTFTERYVKLIRLTSAGVVDATFNGAGTFSTQVNFISVNDIEINTAAQRIYFAGTYNPAAGDHDLFTGAVKYNGTLDTAYDGDGWRIDDIGTDTEDYGTGMTPASDGSYVIVGKTDGEAVLMKEFGGTTATVADYNNGVTDWDQGTNTFGTCLRAVSGSGVAGVWTISATCPATDGAYWNAIPLTSSPAGSKVAQSTTAGLTAATASMRFGMRAGTSQLQGSYYAPVQFDVIAPNV